MTFPIEQMIDKVLFARRDGIVIHRNNNDLSPSVRIVNNGERVGKIFSYTTRAGQIWWMLDKEGNQDIITWVKHNEGDFDKEVLISQGAKTDQQLTEEAKTWWERNKPEIDLTGGVKSIGNIVKYSIILGLAALVIVIMIKVYKA